MAVVLACKRDDSLIPTTDIQRGGCFGMEFALEGSMGIYRDGKEGGVLLLLM